MGKYQKVREIIREVMKDGKVHTAEELHKTCEKRGVEINRNRAEIYNTVYQLKKKGEIVSDGENGYLLVEKKESNARNLFVATRNDSITVSQRIENNAIRKLDFSDFEIVKPAIRKETKQIISVFDNGDLALNGALCKILRTNKVEIHIKKDCSQIILVPGGSVLLDITKNNRIKNYGIYDRLEKKKVKFPVYYVGEWDEETGIWIGDLVMTKPNKNIGKVVK